MTFAYITTAKTELKIIYVLTSTRATNCTQYINKIHNKLHVFCLPGLIINALYSRLTFDWLSSVSRVLSFNITVQGQRPENVSVKLKQSKEQVF